MPQLDDIDIFDRDHMTVEQFDPQGNPVGTKIIFSRSVEDTPIFDSAEDQYVRMIDPTTGAFVEVQSDFPTIQSYIDAGYELEMPSSGPGGSVTRKRTPKRGFKGKYPSAYRSRKKKLALEKAQRIADKKLADLMKSPLPDTVINFNEGGSVEDEDIFGYSLGGSVSEMMGRTGPDLTPAQTAYLAGAFADPYGAADFTGNYFEFPTSNMSIKDMAAGPRAPSFIENLRQGNFVDKHSLKVGAKEKY